jgi:hypothetical protein
MNHFASNQHMTHPTGQSPARKRRVFAHRAELLREDYPIRRWVDDHHIGNGAAL